jgi:hypothetical protein
LNSPTSAYGGNEEIVLKEKRSKEKPKAGKDGEVAEPKNVMHNVHQILLPEYRLPTEAEWNMQLQQMWTKRI